MSHHQQHGGRRASWRVNVNEERECRYWAERLGVHPEELKAAVGAVGDDLDELWRYIDERKHEPQSS
ncbi:MAG: DUF3606 domain-containing protein [Rhodospirillaceae bacterium]